MARKKFTLLVIITLASLTLAQPAFTLKPPAKMNILVYPFRFDGDTSFSWIAAGLTDTVISDLHNLTSVSVFSDNDRKKAIREMELGMTGLVDESTVVKVGSVIGANVIFTGSIQVSENIIRINARLLNVETTKIENTIKLDGTIDGIFELQDRVVTGLMNEAEKIKTSNIAQVKFSKDEIKKIESGYKPKREAYELFSKGLEIRESNPDAALALFLQETVAYGVLQSNLAAVYENLGQKELAGEYYRKSYDTLTRLGYQGKWRDNALKNLKRLGK